MKGNMNKLYRKISFSEKNQIEFTHALKKCKYGVKFIRRKRRKLL